jgi:hypothetical protein
LQQTLPAPALQRLIATFHWSNGGEMLKSRSIYARLAFHVWESSPWTGVGLSRFYFVQDEAAKAAGIELNGWRDNANNYYLQILSELGAFGLLLVTASFVLIGRSLRGEAFDPHFRNDQARADMRRRAARLALAMVAVILLTGPHLLFDEIRYLVCILLALGIVHTGLLEFEGVWRHKLMLMVLAVLIPAFYFITVGSEIQFKQRPLSTAAGFYPLEHGEDGDFAWTSGDARLLICAKDRHVTIRFRTLDPSVVSDPVAVQLSIGGDGRSEEIGSHLLTDTGWETLILSPEVFASRGVARLQINVSRLWRPQGDHRLLGVMVAWPENVCGSAIGTN